MMANRQSTVGVFLVALVLLTKVGAWGGSGFFGALIPAGVLFTLAGVAGADVLVPGVDSGSLFFLGLAATFGYVYRLPNGQRWAHRRARPGDFEQQL